MDTSLLGVGEITPEKLAIMKLEASGEFDQSFLSEPATPLHKRKSLGFSGLSNGHRTSLARTSRQVSSSSRRSSAFMHSHRNKMSMELTTQAEGKFMALMELMAGASREAASLKEYWARLISDRESFLRERDDLMMQIDEVSETLQQSQETREDHSYEVAERRKEIEKLRLELTTALTAISDGRKKATERDLEVERIRQEFSDFRLTSSRAQLDYESVKGELETLRAKLGTVEGERDGLKDSSEKYHSELRVLTREHTDLKSKNVDLVARLESTRKEVLSLTDRIKIWELEREEYLHEKDHLHEELRKVKARLEESLREVFEWTEKHEKAQREATKLREQVRVLEAERDDFAHTIENLRRELKTKTTGLDEAEVRVADITLKYEHIKREVVSNKEKLRDVESEVVELRASLERKQEESRLLIIERDQVKDDLEVERSRVHDGHRQISVLQDSLTRVELTLSEVRVEVFTATERVKTLERERDEHRDKHGAIAAELPVLKDRILLLQAEVRAITEARDRLRHEVSEYRQKYEEVTETITEFQDGSGELEFEIQSLRTMLRESREQKERAIAARNSAERERDEFLAKFEEKCRELERFEEESSRLFHMHGRGETRSSSTRVISRNGTSSKMESGIDG